MPNKTVPKKSFLKAVEEMKSLEKELKAKTKRLKDLRTKMADLFHTGEDGTYNEGVHGYQVKVVRRLGITCDKDAKEQLQEDDEELFDEIFPEKITRSLDTTKAKARLDDLEDYVTTKQGLPVITITELEE